MDPKAQLAELLLGLDYPTLHDFAYRLLKEIEAIDPLAVLTAGDVAEAILETAQDIA